MTRPPIGGAAVFGRSPRADDARNGQNARELAQVDRDHGVAYTSNGPIITERYPPNRLSRVNN